MRAALAVLIAATRAHTLVLPTRTLVLPTRPTRQVATGSANGAPARAPPPFARDETTDGAMGGAVGGAVLGGLLLGPFGALWGAQLGSSFGAERGARREQLRALEEAGLTPEARSALAECARDLGEAEEGMAAARDAQASQRSLIGAPRNPAHRRPRAAAHLPLATWRQRRSRTQPSQNTRRRRRSCAAATRTARGRCSSSGRCAGPNNRSRLASSSSVTLLLSVQALQRQLAGARLGADEAQQRVEQMEESVKALAERAASVEAMLERSMNAASDSRSYRMPTPSPTGGMPGRVEDPLLARFRALEDES